MWQMIVKAAVAGLEGYINAQIANSNIAAGNRVGRANMEAANRVRMSNNKFSAARASFQRWSQVENNKRVLDGAGEAIAANVQNFVRQDKVRTAESFEQSIRDAEQQGAQAAAASASGLTGSLVDGVSAATALRRSRVNESVRQMGEYARYDAGKRAGTILEAGIRGLDSRLIFDGIDYNNNVHTDRTLQNRWTEAAHAAGHSVLGSSNGGLNVTNGAQRQEGNGLSWSQSFNSQYGQNNQYGFTMFSGAGGSATANAAYDATGSFMSSASSYGSAASSFSSFSI